MATKAKATTEKKTITAKKSAKKTTPIKKKGRPEHKPSKKIADAVFKFAEEGGTQKEIADTIDISIDTLVKYYHDIWQKGKNQANLKARCALYDEAVNKRNPSLLMFYCKTQLGMREVNGLELYNPDRSLSPLDITINLVEKNDTEEN